VLRRLKKKPASKKVWMDSFEIATIGTLGMTAFCLIPDATTRALVVGIILAIAVVSMPSATGGYKSFDEHVSARRGVQTPSTQDIDSTRQYPSTANPRHAGATTQQHHEKSRHPATANPRHVKAAQKETLTPPSPSPESTMGEKSRYPSTRNPRHPENEIDKPAAQPAVVPTQELPRTDPYAFAYTHQAMQARREAFIFRSEPLKQSTEARSRMLNSMYQELLDTSVKTDPGLRPVDDTTDGCEPLRGMVKAHIV
tara:strand:+ start:799 stop:1563 length:765 start_codon:yes stop_codon:yes gene_type:complete